MALETDIGPYSHRLCLCALILLPGPQPSMEQRDQHPLRAGAAHHYEVGGVAHQHSGVARIIQPQNPGLTIVCSFDVLHPLEPRRTCFSD